MHSLCVDLGSLVNQLTVIVGDRVNPNETPTRVTRFETVRV